jgi:hypothetical protein
MRLLYVVLSIVVVAGSGCLSEASAAPQTFNTALPVAQGEFVFRQQFFHRRAAGDPTPADRRLDVLGSISVLGYGVTRNLAAFVALPYLHKELDQTTGGRRVTRDTTGLADARLFGRYTLLQRDAPGRTFRIAPLLGIETPTGNDDDRDRLGVLPAPLQPGSGSWDPFGGIVMTYQTLAYQIDGQASYKLNTEANGFELGDEARLDGSIQYRVLPRELTSNVPGFLYAVLEGNLIHQARNRIGGAADPDSGGTTFFASPGIQYVTKRWIVEGLVQLPVSQDLNGSALEDDFIVRAGFRLNF